MTGRRVVPIALLASAGAAELVVLANGQGPVRIGLTFGFLILVPGWALIRLVDLPLDLIARAGLAAALSIAVDMAVATAFFYLRIWSAELAISAVAMITVVSVLLDLPSSRAAIQRSARQAWSALSNLGRP